MFVYFLDILFTCTIIINSLLGIILLIMRNIYTHVLFILLLLLTTSFSSAETTIYLVRHAEKVIADGIKDPGLTQIGQFRANNIAEQLAKIGITDIYATDYKRTIQTAKPLARLMKLKIKKYDPKNLKEFSKQLLDSGGKIVVVGHSNTTPELTKLLSGKEVDSIKEHEFDNLYQVIQLKEKAILNRFKSIPASRLKAKF